MVKRLMQHALLLGLLGLGLPQWLQAQDAVNRSFAPLELRPNDDIDMVLIPAGNFLMGSTSSFKDENDEKPPHAVYLSSFLMGKTEVTQKQWTDVMGRNPSRFSSCGPDCPVENVSWKDARQFISKLNEKAAQKYRLPSEAEWEYAARARTTTDWSFGNDESKLGDYAWFWGNSGQKTHQVGQKLPNAFGLFDMYGNVGEWTEDCNHPSYVGAPTNGSAWTTTCVDNRRVVRGGSWSVSEPRDLRSGYRNSFQPDYSDHAFGLRLARDL